MTAPPTFGSLFSGFGGLECGLERATGGRTLWQVEVDPFCRRVLARHWPEATRHDDVRTVTALAPVDVICGGFPCQDISLAGNGAGIAEGTRSGLWSHFARIVDENKPRAVVIENVAALARRGLARVLGDLDDLGFVGTWDVVSAASVGAPHLRRRIFVVAAHPERVQLRDESGWRGGACWARARIAADARQAGPAAQAAADGHDRRRRSEERDDDAAGAEAGADADGCAAARDASWLLDWCGRLPASPVRGMDDGSAGSVERPRRRRRRPVNDRHRLHGLGNAVVPQAAEVAGHVLAAMLDLRQP